MIELNVTAVADQTKNYASIIGPVLGGIIAASAGIYLSNYKEKREVRDHQAIVAKALYEQMTSYNFSFELLFENYTTTKFDEADKETKIQYQKRQTWEDPNEIGGPTPLKEFEFSAIDEIRQLGIATTGKHAKFLPDLCPFTIFYEDIFKFDDTHEIQNLMQFYQYLAIADNFFKNYCNEDMEYPNPYDLRRFLESIEYASSLMREESILNYLKRKSSIDTPLWKKISLMYRKKIQQLLQTK